MKETDDALSARSIKRQVDREGARWGLEGQIAADGTVKVCDRVHVAETRFGMGEVTKRPRILCTVNEDAPFSAALNNRIDNGETDIARRFRLHDEIEQQAMQKKIDETDAEIREQWKGRKRITFGPQGLFIPAGLAEREAYRRRR